MALLVVLVLLIGLVTVAQRGPRPATEGASFDETALQGDIAMKLYYAYQRWSTYFRGAGFGQTETAMVERYRSMAIKNYQDAAAEDPSPGTLRKLIIVQTPKDKASAIGKLALLSGQHERLVPEVAMWRAIYLSKTPISKGQLRAYQTRVQGLHLGWFRHLALADLYTRAGLNTRAAAERTAAEISAVHTVSLLGAVVVVMATIGLIGFILLIAFLTSMSSGQAITRDEPLPESEPARSFVAGYLLEAFVVYLTATIGIQAVAAGILLTNPMLDKPQTAVGLTFGVYVAAGLVAFAYLAWRLRRAGWSWSTIGLITRNPGKDILWGIGGYAASLPLILIAGLLSRVLGRYVQTPSNPVVPLFVEANTASQRILLFLLVSVAAPFFEETFFRGALFHSFKAQWGVRLGILLSAVGFALVHPFPMNFLPILALGSVFAFIVNRRGSLLPSMVAHSLNNTFSFLLLLILTGS